MTPTRSPRSGSGSPTDRWWRAWPPGRRRPARRGWWRPAPRPRSWRRSPLRVLGPHVPDPEVLGTWLQLGLATVGDVAALPAGVVLGRFGPDGRWVHRLAQGLDPRRAAPRAGPPRRGRDGRPRPARGAQRRGGLRGADARRRPGRAPRRGRPGLHPGRRHVAHRPRRVARAVLATRRPGPARRGRPAAGRGDHRPGALAGGRLAVGPGDDAPTAGVSRLVLAPGSVEPARGRQLGFWGGEGGADERVVRAVARLEALVGPDAVRVAEARGGRHPGDEVELVPTTAVDVSVARPVALPGLDDAARPRGRAGSPRRRRRCCSTLPARSSCSTRRGARSRSTAAARSVTRPLRWSWGATRVAPAGRVARWWPGRVRGRSTSAGGTPPRGGARPGSRSSPRTAPRCCSPAVTVAGGSPPATADAAPRFDRTGWGWRSGAP